MLPNNNYRSRLSYQNSNEVIETAVAQRDTTTFFNDFTTNEEVTRIRSNSQATAQRTVLTNQTS